MNRAAFKHCVNGSGDGPDWDYMRWPIVDLADFDRDGAMDVVVADQPAAQLAVISRAGTRRVVLGPLDPNAFSYRLFAQDLNGDGRPDVRIWREDSFSDESDPLDYPPR